MKWIIKSMPTGGEYTAKTKINYFLIVARIMHELYVGMDYEYNPVCDKNVGPE
jgi:hypothetical protein